jgi:hypothetical protein
LSFLVRPVVVVLLDNVLLILLNFFVFFLRRIFIDRPPACTLDDRLLVFVLSLAIREAIREVDLVGGTGYLAFALGN